MVLSMIACIAGCLVLLSFIPRQQSTPRPTVPLAPVAREISSTKHWDVAVAKGIGEPWRPVNVLLVPAGERTKERWQAGYQGAGEDYIAIDQTKDGGAAWVKELAGGDPAGELTAGGVTWKKVVLPKNEQKALVRSQPLGGLDTIVTGKGTWDQLAQFAAAATPFSKAQ